MAQKTSPSTISGPPLGEIFRRFLVLGCCAFGGPVAHLGYYQREFVDRRQWLTSARYAELMALCQFLPGPSSSQLGFAIGRERGGLLGAFAAWLGFTLPSALLMLLFAASFRHIVEFASLGMLQGLKLAAFAIVANAAWNLSGRLCPTWRERLVATGSVALLLLLGYGYVEPFVILLGMLAGVFWIRPSITLYPPEQSGQIRSGNLAVLTLLTIFALLLLLAFVARVLWPDSTAALLGSFYTSGSLVFGGGHVVLPLLQSSVVAPGWVNFNAFVAGYGLAQALPGPLFAFSAFLGSTAGIGPGGVIGGILALVAIYLPAWLLVLGVLPLWEILRKRAWAQKALVGANAVVVGLLFVALYHPLGTTTLHSPIDWIAGALGLALLHFTRLPAWGLVLAFASGGWFFL